MSRTGRGASVRLGVVQHGDYREALRLIASGEPETYFGMKDSVAVLERFLAGTTYRIISVDAPEYREARPGGEIVGLHRPNWRKASKLPWAWSVYRRICEFRPTHLLMRTGGVLAYPSLRYAVRRGLPSLVLLAGFMENHTRGQRWFNRHLLRLFNHPSVFRVANHRRPATLSTLACGVEAAKVVAWDFPDLPRPADVSPKTLDGGAACHVVYAGTLFPGKGVGDLIDADAVLHRSSLPVRLTVCGDGPQRGELEGRGARLPQGAMSFPGRVSNAQVRQLMREATIVCVPSRKESSEGLPFTVTEALAARTPLVCSDHPAMSLLLRDGEGLRFFESGNAGALAEAIRRIVRDPVEYERLSRTAEQAFARLDADVMFGDLLTQWRAAW